MSELTLNVLEEHRSCHGRLHGSVIDALVASLGADPETIEELELASGRFMQRDADHPVFASFRQGICDEAWDAGLVYIDLTARLVCSESTYSHFLREGQEFWHDGHCRTDKALPFHLAEDWEFASDALQFHGLSGQRRAVRAAQPRIDEREIIYGRLPEKIVLAVHRQRAELLKSTQDELESLVRQIHADWLLTPQEELHGRAPRDVLLDKRHHHIGMDVQWQQHHWSMLRRSPPAIPRESAAYRYAGFGTHEIVTYYDFVRDMIWEAVSRWRERAPDETALPDEAEHLQRFRQDWLHEPNPEFHGRTPASIIDKERRRLPEKASGDEAVVDPDCPAGQMMGDEEQFGPAFWGLDGCNMDDDFAFSFHRTREEWDAERRKWEEFNREFNRQQELRAQGLVPDDSDDFDDMSDPDDVPF
jgi:hypothetical protein